MAFSRYNTVSLSISNNYVLIYLGLCLITVACNFIRTVIQYRGSLRASNRLFLGLLQSVCHAPLQFFDITPVSQIMSRFSKDMETVDSSIGWHVNFLLQTVFGVFGVVFTIGTILPEFFAASLVAGTLLFHDANYTAYSMCVCFSQPPCTFILASFTSELPGNSRN